MGASAEVSGERAAGGEHAVKLSVPAGGDSRSAMLSIAGLPVFPAHASNLYGRAMMYMPANASAPSHSSFIVASGSLMDGSEAAYQFSAVQVSLGGFDLLPPGVRGEYSDAVQGGDHFEGETLGEKYPPDRWTCWEWHFDAERSLAELWRDGEKLTAGIGPNSEFRAPAFDRLRIGYRTYPLSSEGDVSLWVDDIVLDDKPIGCP